MSSLSVLPVWQGKKDYILLVAILSIDTPEEGQMEMYK